LNTHLAESLLEDHVQVNSLTTKYTRKSQKKGASDIDLINSLEPMPPNADDHVTGSRMWNIMG
jgi:hypothetical protein